MIQVLIISSLYSQTQHLRRILLGRTGTFSCAERQTTVCSECR